MMSVEQVTSLIKNKHHFYKALVSFGFFLPDYKMSIITTNFLNDVRKTSVYMLKLADV